MMRLFVVLCILFLTHRGWQASRLSSRAGGGGGAMEWSGAPARRLWGGFGCARLAGGVALIMTVLSLVAIEYVFGPPAYDVDIAGQALGRLGLFAAVTVFAGR